MLPLPIHRLPHQQNLVPVVHLLQLINHHWHIIPNPWFTLRFILGFVCSVGFDKYVVTYIYHYSTLHHSFIALKTPYVPFTRFSFFQTLETTDLYTVSIVLHIPECHIIEITQYVSFPDWFISLGNIHLSFFHVFLWVMCVFHPRSCTRCAPQYPGMGET